MNAAIKLSSPATQEFWEIPILFEDEHLLALEKPAGVLAASDAENITRPNLISLLHAGIETGKPWARERGLDYLNPAYWLDSDTGGVWLLAKNKSAFMTLADLLSSEKPARKFVALVRGTPRSNEFEVDKPLSPHPIKPGLMRVDTHHGKKTKTRFTLLESFPRFDYALLRCEPVIERQHQIRVHLSDEDLPVVCDELYGGKKLWLSRLKPDYRLKEGREERPLISRAAIHAEELVFPHPVTGQTLTIKSEWPKDLKVAVKYLRQFSV